MWSNIQVFIDDNVSKYVFEKQDIAVESVLYRYPTYEERTVLCISVMCGCPIGCRFCGTGDFFVRALTAEEIVAQAEYILESQIGSTKPRDIKKLQIMVMSMGEPALVPALQLAFRTLYRMYPNAQLLISTSGPQIDYKWIRDLSVEIPTVGLQFSVHESTDAARNELIPFKKKLTLSEIAHEGIEWYRATGRYPFFNYCAHEKNSTWADADRLGELFNPSIWNATVSVICERDSDKIAGRTDVPRELASEFSIKLVSLGFNVRVFDPAGQDTIGGGCGMLKFVQEWAEDHADKVRPSCGSGLPKVHAPFKNISVVVE